MLSKVTSVTQFFKLKGVLMKRAGFTMIELIFVIVILGILAAVAIPKLAATRNDASAATLATSAATCINDEGGAYMMNGNFTANGAITKTTAGISNACLDILSTPASGASSNCYTLTANDANGTLTINGQLNGAVCAAALGLTDRNSLTNGETAVTHQF